MKSSRWINFVVLFVLTIVMISGRSVDIQRVEAATLEEGVLFVKPDSSGAEDCSSWDDACKLQDGLDAALYGDQIWVASGIYTPTYQTDSENPRSVTFEMEIGVAIYGGFTGSEIELVERDWETNITVLSGDLEGNDITDSTGVISDTSNIVGSNAYHVVSSEGVTETAILDGFNITGGNADDEIPYLSINSYGGGMHNESSSPALTNVTFSGNTALLGGGMYNQNSDPTLTNVTFSGNTAGIHSGGMYNRNSDPTLTNVTFSDNTAGTNGGGMYNDEGSPVLTNVTFSGNSATDYGGGMYSAAGSPVLNNVVYSGNTAGTNGGGLYGSSHTLTDVVFSGNTAGTNGGGMYNSWNSPVLTNVTFSGNTAGTNGGGMYNSWNSPVLTNVTFSGNTADDGGGMYNYTYDKDIFPVLTEVTFSGNTANNGGGLYNYNQYSGGNFPLLTDVTFNGNTANYGGGMYNRYSSPTLTNLKFIINQAFYYGGGMYNQGGNPDLANVIFCGNTAQLGGGMFNKSSSPALSNVSFSGNTAGFGGGGMFNAFSSPVLTNVTFSGNISNASGGGLYNYDNSDPIITNAILWGNTAQGSGQQIINDEQSFTSVSYSDIQDGCESILGNDCSAGGNISADPLFVRAPYAGADETWGTEDDDYGDLRLGLLSPAIDAGDNSTVPAEVTIDLDGNPRFMDIPTVLDTGYGVAPIVDMGAYEAENLLPIAADDLDYITLLDMVLVIPAPGVLANDNAPNHGLLSAVLEDSPSTGDLTLIIDGSFEYFPEIGYSGIVTFTYRATDGILASLPANVSITVKQVQGAIFLPLISH